MGLPTGGRRLRRPCFAGLMLIPAHSLQRRFPCRQAPLYCDTLVHDDRAAAMHHVDNQGNPTMAATRKQPYSRRRAATKIAPPPKRNWPAIPHDQGLRISSMVTGWFYETQRRMATQIKPHDVIRLMNKARVKFVLMGAHGIAGWMEQPRSTQDVDILVQPSHHRKAVGVIRKAYTDLTEEDLPGTTRFTDPTIGKVVIDLMKPVEALNKQALKTAVPVGKTHRVPSLEMALACKYAAMRGANRDALKRGQDAVDFGFVAKHNLDRIDMDILFSLGEMVRSGGGPEIQKLVDQVKAGRLPQIPP